MKSLSALCGCDLAGGAKIEGIQQILGKDIQRYGNAVVAMRKADADPDQVSLFGSFAARKLLEAGCVAVLCRMDPTRLLVLREFQIRGKYALAERHPASIDWRGDVLSEKKAGWTDTVSPDKFIRSLLGGHMAEVMWVDAIAALAQISETDPALAESKWIDELIGYYDDSRQKREQQAAEAPPQDGAGGGQDKKPADPRAELGLLSILRTQAETTFSTLSKGVHVEFVVDRETIFDNGTILEQMRLATKLLTQIAFVSHLNDCNFNAMSPADALKLVLQIEGEIEK